MRATDNDLILAYQQGDERAFDVLSRRYKGWVMSFFFGICYFDREELTQDVFLKAWGSLCRFDINKASFKTWLTAIVKHVKIDFLRKQKREKGTLSIDAALEENQAFEEELVSGGEELVEWASKAQIREKVNEAVRSLLPDEQEVIYLRFWEEMTYDEIGQIIKDRDEVIIGMSPDEARRRCKKALDKLKRQLGGV